jgi:hypothetical protein
MLVSAFLQLSNGTVDFTGHGKKHAAVGAPPTDFISFCQSCNEMRAVLS